MVSADYADSADPPTRILEPQDPYLWCSTGHPRPPLSFRGPPRNLARRRQNPRTPELQNPVPLALDRSLVLEAWSLPLEWSLVLRVWSLQTVTCNLQTRRASGVASREAPLVARQEAPVEAPSVVYSPASARASSLYLDLDLDVGPDLNLDLNLNLGHPLFETLSRQSFAPLFLLSSPALTLGFWFLTSDFFLRLLLPPRQSVGRPLPGRIVVRDLRTTTYR